MKSTFKTKLLLGAAGIALGAFAASPAQAADIEMAGSVGTPGATQTFAANSDDLLNATATNAVDVTAVNINGGDTAENIDIDNDALLAIIDGTGDGNNDTLAFTGFADILAGKTFTILGGATEADDTGTATTDEELFVTIAGNLGGTAGTTLTQGGTLALLGANDGTASTVLTVSANGNTNLTAVSVTGGNGGANTAGVAVVGNFGNAASDTFNATGVTVKGGAADAGGDKAGGDATFTGTAVSTIGATGLAITGGAGANNASGGAAAATFSNGLTLSGATTVTSGETDTGAGGTASLTLTKGATSSSTLSVVGATVGTVAATVTTSGDTTFSKITLDDGAANAAATLVADATTNDTGDFTITGAIDGGAAGEGTLIISDDTATNNDTVTFVNNIGATNKLELVRVGVSGADGGHAVFNGSVAATTLTVGVTDLDGDEATVDANGNISVATLSIFGGNTGGEDATVTASGNITATTEIELDDNTAIATLTFDGTNQTVEGVVDGQADEDGVVNVGTGTSNTTVTFNGVIGGNNDIETFNIRENATAVITKNVSVQETADTNVAINVDGTMRIDSDGDAITVLTGAAGGDIDVTGALNVVGDNNVVVQTAGTNNDIFIDGILTTALTDSKTLALTGADNQTDILIGTVKNATLTLGNQVVTTGDVTIGGTNRVNTLNIKKTAAFNPSTLTTGLINAADDAVTVATDGVLNIGIASDSAEFDAGETITVIDSNTAIGGGGTYTTLINNGDIVLVDTALLDLQNDSSDNNDLKIRIAYKDVGSVIQGGPGVNAANTLLTQINSAQTTGELQTVRATLANAGAATVQAVAESIAPTVDAGNVVGAMTVAGQTQSVTNTRLASLRQGGSETGMMAGDVTHGLQAWAQVFGSTGEQDRRDNIAGFEADTVGIAAGVDTRTLAENLTLGVAFSYADTDVDSSNVNSTETEIDSYQFTLYGNYDLDDRTYLVGQLGYAMHENETTRQNVGTVAGLNANGDYDADQFSAYAEIGRDYEFNQTTLTPNFLMSYSHYDADGYTETGAGTAGLNVEQEEINIFEVGVGIDASWLFQQRDGSYVSPELRLGVRHDLIGDEVETTSNFIGVPGTSFRTQGFDPAQTTFDIGAGVTYFSTDNWELTANYDYELKSDYDAHSGFLRAAYKF